MSRGRITFHPNLTVFKNFFLPNRHGAFEFADGPLAGFEGRAAVRRADGYDDARLADFQTTGAMHDADVRDVELFVNVRAQFFHLAQSHRFVSFVHEIKCAPPLGPFARVAVERNRRAAFRKYDAASDSADIDRLGGQFEEIVGLRSRQDARASAADGRKDCQLVAVANLSVWLGVFLIDREQK